MNRYIFIMKYMGALLVLLFLLAQVESKSEYKVVGSFTYISIVELKLQYKGQDNYYLKPTNPIVK